MKMIRSYVCIRAGVLCADPMYWKSPDGAILMFDVKLTSSYNQSLPLINRYREQFEKSPAIRKRMRRAPFYHSLTGSHYDITSLLISRHNFFRFFFSSSPYLSPSQSSMCLWCLVAIYSCVTPKSRNITRWNGRKCKFLDSNSEWENTKTTTSHGHFVNCLTIVRLIPIPTHVADDRHSQTQPTDLTHR